MLDHPPGVHIPKAYALDIPFLAHMVSWEAEVTHRFGQGPLSCRWTTDVQIRFATDEKGMHEVHNAYRTDAKMLLGVGTDYFSAYITQARIDHSHDTFLHCLEGSLAIKCFYTPPASPPRRLHRPLVPVSRIRPIWKFARKASPSKPGALK